MGIYDTQTTLQLILDKGSLVKASKNIADSFNKSVSGMKGQFEAGKAGQSGMYGYQGPGAGLARGAGNVAAGAEKSGLVGGMGKTMAPMLKALGPLAIIAAVIKELWQFISPIFKLFALVLITLFMPVLKLIKPFLTDIPQKLEDFRTWIQSLPENIAKALGDILGGAAEFAGGAVQATSDFLGGIAATLLEIGQFLWDLLVEYFTLQFNILLELGTFLWDTLTNIFTTGLEILNTIGDFIVRTFEDIIRTSFVILDKIGDFVNLLMQGKFDEAFKVLEDIGQEVFDLVMRIIGDGINTLKDIGQSLVDLIMDTIKSGLSTLANIGQLIYESILNTIAPVSKPAAGLLGDLATGAGNLWSAINPFDDFISRPGSKPQPFNANDTIVGMKDLSKLGGKQVVLDYKPTYNISAATDRNELKRIFEEHDEKVKREFQSALSYVTNLRG